MRVTIATAARRRPTSTCCRTSGRATPGPGRRASEADAGLQDDGTVLATHAHEEDRRLSSLDDVEWLFCENETNRRRLYGDDAAGYFKDGINDRVVDGRPWRRRPGQHGHQMRRLVASAAGAGRRRTSAPALRPHRCARARRRELRRGVRAAASRRRTSSTPPCRPTSRPRRAARAAAGLRGHALVQAVLPPRRAPLAGRRPDHADAAGRAPDRPRQRLAPPLQRRHHLHAGQVGVSLVRGLGPRLPLHGLRADRPGVRQGAAHPADARMVHASRTASCPPTSGTSAT